MKDMFINRAKLSLFSTSPNTRASATDTEKANNYYGKSVNYTSANGVTVISAFSSFETVQYPKCLSPSWKHPLYT